MAEYPGGMVRKIPAFNAANVAFVEAGNAEQLAATAESLVGKFVRNTKTGVKGRVHCRLSNPALVALRIAGKGLELYAAHVTDLQVLAKRED